MADTNKLLNANIYDLHSLVDDLKLKYIPEEELTLAMGMYGYMGDINSLMLQNAVVMAAEYSNEAIPTKAKFEKNIISHALSLGIKNINAVPAYMNVAMIIPEELLLLNMNNDVFIFDKNVPIYIDTIEFHTKYDIKIKRAQLPTGEKVYTAMYDTSIPTPLEKDYIVNPYLPPIMKVMNNNEPVIIVQAKIVQTEYKPIEDTIITKNPLESKTMQFKFNNQLAGFDVYIKEYDKDWMLLNPIYDGLFHQGKLDYCNYNYVDESTIRIMFTNRSYLPNMNTNVKINLYTCQGAKGNFNFKDDIMLSPRSERFKYDRLNITIRPLSASTGGVNTRSIESLKEIIPQEALARGSVTNSKDINNFFNSIDLEVSKNRMYFFKKMDSPLARLYYSFLLLSTNKHIIPTNTIPINMEFKDFNNRSHINYIFDSGNTIMYSNDSNGVVLHDPSKEDIKKINDTGFIYINPFMCVINKSPLFVSYYLNIINATKFLEFEWINDKSRVQFISSLIDWKREYFTDKDTYKCDIDIMQNINTDINVIHRDDIYDPYKITSVDIKVIAVIYNEDNTPHRWIGADFVSFDESSFTYHYQFKIKTDNAMNNKAQINITNMKEIGTNSEANGFMTQNSKMKIFTFVKNTYGATSKYNYAQLFPSEETNGYCLTNVYSVKNGIDFLYNYTDIIDSNIKVNRNSTGGISYLVDKVPVIGYSYINREYRIKNFIDILEEKRSYIMDCLKVLEDAFGIDIKFFNTYGPSKLFYVDNNTMLNRCNLSMKFRLKLVNNNDKYIIDYIKDDIREYIEDTAKLSDLHIPNLITYITKKYRETLVYFEFLDFNGYGPGFQHIYRKDESLVGKIPEFLNINTANTKDFQSDITIIVD